MLPLLALAAAAIGLLAASRARSGPAPAPRMAPTGGSRQWTSTGASVLPGRRYRVSFEAPPTDNPDHYETRLEQAGWRELDAHGFEVPADWDASDAAAGRYRFEGIYQGPPREVALPRARVYVEAP